MNGVVFQPCGCCVYRQCFIIPAKKGKPESYVFSMPKVSLCRSCLQKVKKTA